MEDEYSGEVEVITIDRFVDDCPVCFVENAMWEKGLFALPEPDDTGIPQPIRTWLQCQSCGHTVV